MAGDTFRRYEKKYQLTNEQFYPFLEELLQYMDVDDFSKETGFYLITNIYYDTKDHDLIRRSIDKPVYKEKLRLRSYGVPDLDTKCFIEIKKKYDGIVSKRRIRVPLSRAYKFLTGEDDLMDLPKVNRQMQKEIGYFMKVYPVKPMLYLSYERKALAGKEDKEFRVTFDKNITARRNDLLLEHGVSGEVILKDKWLMEVKVLGAVPMWFTKLLSKYKIYPISFSKYGTEYQNYVLDMLSLK